MKDLNKHILMMLGFVPVKIEETEHLQTMLRANILFNKEEVNSLDLKQLETIIRLRLEYTKKIVISEIESKLERLAEIIEEQIFLTQDENS